MTIPILSYFAGRRSPPGGEIAPARTLGRDFKSRPNSTGLGQILPYNPDDLIGKRGYAIYDQMQRDAQVQACLTDQEARGAVARLGGASGVGGAEGRGGRGVRAVRARGDARLASSTCSSTCSMRSRRASPCWRSTTACIDRSRTGGDDRACVDQGQGPVDVRVRHGRVPERAGADAHAARWLGSFRERDSRQRGACRRRSSWSTRICRVTSRPTAHRTCARPTSTTGAKTC